MPLDTDVNSNVLDPFETTNQLFVAYLRSNAERVRGYEEELQSYSLTVPEFMRKSADKFICEFLDLLTEAEIERPTVQFLATLRHVKDKLEEEGEDYVMVNIMYERLTENVQMLSDWKSTKCPKEKKAIASVLKDRGFF